MSEKDREKFREADSMLSTEISALKVSQMEKGFFRKMPVIGILMDNRNGGVILAVNKLFCEYTGYSEIDVLGKKFHEFIHPDYLEGTSKLYEEWLRVEDFPYDLFYSKWIGRDGGDRDMFWVSSRKVDVGHDYSVAMALKQMMVVDIKGYPNSNSINVKDHMNYDN